MRCSRPLVLAAVALGLAAPLAPSPAQENKSSTDRVWTAPDLASFPVASIAMLSPALYDDNAEHRRMIENAIAPALKGSGHRWVSPFLVRDNLMRAGGDSLSQALNQKLLASPRVDSLDAPFLSRTLRARALFTVRADQMERVELEVGQAGRPRTTVRLHAALVDSTGRLLWSANSSETLEGSRQEASGNVIGVRTSTLNPTAVGLTTTAPMFPEVLSKIATRWGAEFPKRAKAAGAKHDAAKGSP
jgi:hypothetical protein